MKKIIHLRGVTFQVAWSKPQNKVPLLLLNGVQTPSSFFLPLQQALNRPTLVVTTLNHLFFLSLEAHALLVAEIMTLLHLEQADVLGVSWGGTLAQTLARHHPERVRRLVLAATTAEPTSLPGKNFFEAFCLGNIGGSDVKQNPEVLRHMEGGSEGGVVSDFWKATALFIWSSTAWLHTIPHPTLLMAGEEDDLTPLSGMERMAKKMPHAQFHREPKAGHLFPLTRAHKVAPVIDRFLDEERDKRPAHRRVHKSEALSA